MSARQQHGFDYEDSVFERYPNLVKSKTYTSQWDGYFKSTPTSIKTKKLGNAVEMGSFQRVSSVHEDFILIIGFWGGEDKNTIVEEKFFLIDGKWWKALFPEPERTEMNDVFDGISNSESDDEKWWIRRKDYTKRWKDSGSPINIHFKRDHKNQKRTQCSIPFNFLDSKMEKFSISEKLLLT